MEPSTSRTPDDDALRDALARVLGTQAGVDPVRDSSPGTLVRLVGVAVRAEGELRRLVHESVSSARAAGASWDAVGAELGMTRQAAQQRFGRAGPAAVERRDEPGTAPPERRRLDGVTALAEMDELELAGRHGWHSVGFGARFHTLERSVNQWEHRRVGFVGSARARLEREGWQTIGTWFPWVYLKRDLGTPAAPEPAP